MSNRHKPQETLGRCGISFYLISSFFLFFFLFFLSLLFFHLLFYFLFFLSFSIFIFFFCIFSPFYFFSIVFFLAFFLIIFFFFFSAAIASRLLSYALFPLAFHSGSCGRSAGVVRVLPGTVSDGERPPITRGRPSTYGASLVLLSRPPTALTPLAHDAHLLDVRIIIRMGGKTVALHFFVSCIGAKGSAFA